LAASEGHYELVQFMLDCKADIHCTDRWGGTPLSDAKRHGHAKIEQLLLRYGAVDTAAAAVPAVPAAAYASASASTSASAAEHGPSEGERMCMAAAKGRLEEIKRLVAGGASVNAADYDRRSALHLAAAEGHDAVVAYLITSGAAVNARDRWGTMPLSDAVRGGHAAAQETLRRAGGTTGHDDHSDHASKFGEKLCHAAARGDLAEIKSLVARGGSVNAADYDGRSALHLAAAEGHDAVVEFLVEEKADVLARDRWGADPLKDAVRSGHRTVQAILLEAGAALPGGGGRMSVDALREEIEVPSERSSELARAESERGTERQIRDKNRVTEG
jgi:ankyrin repeat protein